MLAIADAEREVEEIRSGKRSLEKAKYVLSLTKETQEKTLPSLTAHAPLLEVASNAAVADAMRKELNVAKAVLKSEDDLKNDPTPPPSTRWMRTGSIDGGTMQARYLLMTSSSYGDAFLQGS